MDSLSFRHIAVEGPIGVGKTSVARQLATHLGADLMLEAPEQNPFMPIFYQDIPRYAFLVQLSFLMQRMEQAQQIETVRDAGKPLISDYLWHKDALFAELNLTADELALYQNISTKIPMPDIVPDLVILLQAPTETLLKRVHQRGIPHEQGMTLDYLEQVSQMYSRFFLDYEAAPVLVVNCEKLDFVHNPQNDFALLLECIQQMRGPRGFFNVA